jgi:hypothetical protein
LPYPGSTLITPSGTPASAQISANFKALNGVYSAGLRTVVHPVANIGPNFIAAIARG